MKWTIFLSACFLLALGLAFIRPRKLTESKAWKRMDSRRALFQLLAKLELKNALKMYLYERRRPIGPRK